MHEEIFIRVPIATVASRLYFRAPAQAPPGHMIKDRIRTNCIVRFLSDHSGTVSTHLSVIPEADFMHLPTLPARCALPTKRLVGGWGYCL